MYKPLLIWNMNPIIPDNDLFHHVCPQRMSLFLYDPYKHWCEGRHDARERIRVEKKKASEILFVRLSSAFNDGEGFHSEMRSTTASN